MSEFEYRILARPVARIASIDEGEGTVYLELETSRGAFVTLREGDVSDFEFHLRRAAYRDIALGVAELEDGPGYIELGSCIRASEKWPNPPNVGELRMRPHCIA